VRGYQVRLELLRLNFIFVLFALLPACATPSQKASSAERCPASGAGACADLFSSVSLQPSVFFRESSREGSTTQIQWSSRVLHATSVKSEARLDEIINLLLRPSDLLNEEIARFQKDLAGKGDATFWNTYFKMYDGILGFCEGYLKIFERASQSLPQTGKIVDYGFGTGNGSASLLLLGSRREIYGVDFSSLGLERAEAKLQKVAVLTGSQRAKLQVADLTEARLPQSRFDGALMNNVLYAIPKEKRLALLKKILGELKPGARFVISDPVRSLQTNPEAIRKLLKDVFHSSVTNGSPMTEFDFAFFGFLNIKFLMGGGVFLTPTEITQLAEKAGFQVESIEPSYYGAAALAVLRRPPNS
jgi:SAM-dependent methyltransferase